MQLLVTYMETNKTNFCYNVEFAEKPHHMKQRSALSSLLN